MEAMVTTSWALVCIDVVKKWWDMMSSLESDLRELRSLDMTSSSLTQDSRSIRYEANKLLINSNTPCASTSAADNMFMINNCRTQKHSSTCHKAVNRVRGEPKKVDYFRRIDRTSTYHYVAPEPYPKYKQGMYKTLKAGLGVYDLLGLIHLVPAPWDHAFKPPYYPPLPASTTLQFGIIEID